PGTERVIQRIDADGAHLDENLALLVLRAWQLDEPVFAVVAVGSVLDGLHRTARCWVAADRADGRSMPFQTQVVADKSGNYPFIGENPFSESSMGYAMGFRLWRRRPTRNSPWQILPPFGWICSAGEMTRTKLRAPRDPNAAASAKFHHLLGYGQFFRWRNGFRPNYRHPLPSHKLYAESRNSKFRDRSVLLCCRGRG